MSSLGELLAAPLPSAPEDPVADVVQRVTSMTAEHAELIDYLCRALVENTPAGVRIFDGLFQISTGYWDQLAEQGLTQPGLDPLFMVLSPLTLVLGTFVLRSHLDRQLPQALTTHPAAEVAKRDAGDHRERPAAKAWAHRPGLGAGSIAAAGNVLN